MEWMLMPLRRYADFSGRSRRMEFWMWQLGKFLVGMVLGVLFSVLAGGALMTAGNDPERLVAAGGTLMVLWLICMIFALAIIIPDIAVTVRRLHDTNRSGWWILAPLVPYLIFWVTFGMAMSSGRPEEAMTGGMGMIGIVAILVAVVLAFTLLVFYFLDGTPGPNRFGPDPKGRGAEVFS